MEKNRRDSQIIVGFLFFRIFLEKAVVLQIPEAVRLTCTAAVSYTHLAEVDPVLDEEYLRQMTENYAAGQDYENPLISPLFADVTDFPPTYIQVGDNEVLLSDATMLHKKMIKANVPARLDVYKGMWHVFQLSLIHIL